MKRIFLVFTLIIAFCQLSQAESKKAQPLTHTPWIMNVSDTSFTVLFTTAKPAMCWVEVAPDDGTAWEKMERRRFWQDISGRHYLGTCHKIQVTALEAGKSYRYRVYGQPLKDGKNPYNIKWDGYFCWKISKKAKDPVVRTLDAKADTCRFCMVNDMHYRDALYSSLVSGMDKRCDFIVLNGDIVSYCTSIDTVLTHTFSPIAKYAFRYPIMFARGNHEGRGVDWLKLPYFFPTPTGEFYYTFRQGPVAFIVLDAGEDKADSNAEYFGMAAFDKYRQRELEWLKKAVKEEAFLSAPQKVCIMHIPSLNNAKAWYCQQWISENFTPVLEAAGIKLMLSGHHHKYMLSKPGENGCGYTIVVNSNNDRLDFTGTADCLKMRIYNKEGELKHSIDL